MISAVGIDIVDVPRIAKLLSSHPNQINRIFTEEELEKNRLEDFQRKASELFAGKEAVLKALGTGWNNGMSWTDIEILGEENVFSVRLSGTAKKTAEEKGFKTITVSLSSTSTQAVAQAIAVTD